MTDAEELKFVGLCLIDIGQSMRDLSAAFQQFCEKLRREAELAHDHSEGHEAGDLREPGAENLEKWHSCAGVAAQVSPIPRTS